MTYDSIIDGLRSKSLFSAETIERIRQLCAVIPLDHPIECSFFWDYQKKGYGIDEFLRFLAETGTPLGACDGANVDPIQLYRRPEDTDDREYTVDGDILDELYGFDGTWGEFIDPEGDEVANYPSITELFIDELFDMARGDLSTLPAKLNACDWCIRHYENVDDGATFEGLWSTETWARFNDWCDKQGISNPYTTDE